MTNNNWIEAIAPWIVPLFTFGIVVVVQCIFWIPTISSYTTNDLTPDKSQSMTKEGEDCILSTPTTPSTNMNKDETSTEDDEEDEDIDDDKKDGNDEKDDNGDNDDDNDEDDLFKMNDQWRCACEGGFLPPGMLKSFGGAEAMMRLGTGQCYHKQM